MEVRSSHFTGETATVYLLWGYPRVGEQHTTLVCTTVGLNVVTRRKVDHPVSSEIMLIRATDT